MLVKKGNHYTICAINHQANTDTRPLANILRRYCITVMAHAIKKDCELDSNRKLRIIRSVGENGMMGYLIQDIVKDVRMNT